MSERKTSPRTCKKCGGSFLARPSKVKNGQALFCKPSCAHDFYRKPRGIGTPPSPKRPCALCLAQLGFGYDRIAKKLATQKQWVYTTVSAAKRRGSLILNFTRRLHIPTPKTPNPVDIVARSLKRINNNAKKRRVCRLRRYVWQWLFRGVNSPTAETMTGCSRAFFLEYIQSKFSRGMAWNNYATHWQLDHITPCAAFDLTNPSQVLRCFHYSNYRPLSRHQNAVKHARIIPHQPELTLSLYSPRRSVCRLNPGAADSPAITANREPGNSIGTGHCLTPESSPSPVTQPDRPRSIESTAAPRV